MRSMERSGLIRSSMVSALTLALMANIAICPGAIAGESEAKALLKAMTDYVSAQRTISFAYDVNLEVVTKDH